MVISLQQPRVGRDENMVAIDANITITDIKGFNVKYENSNFKEFTYVVTFILGFTSTFSGFFWNFLGPSIVCGLNFFEFHYLW